MEEISVGIPELKRVIKFLMQEIREQERLRDECLQGKTIHEPIPPVTDEDVETRIREVLGN